MPQRSNHPQSRNTADLPSALACQDEIAGHFNGKRPAVFLDYDGVLTPIVRHPQDALMSAEMRRTVRRLAELCPVALVSGRDLRDVRQLAGIEGIAYAGSHGFDIQGPAGGDLAFRQGSECLPALDRAEQALQERLSGIAGVRVERKKFAVAVHFREGGEKAEARVQAVVDGVRAATPGLRRTGGKKVFELRPDIDWDKGRAVFFLMRQLELDDADFVPFYLGDDLTDEDAFRALQGRGVGIVVRDEPRPSYADYALEDTEEVRLFLATLAQRLGG
ncbi:MAG: trehalose-phosphatase [Desulfuromonadales bacterium]